MGGAFQPLPAFSSSSVTLAPYGGSDSSSFFSASPAFTPSSVGGMRSDNFTAVNGRSTLPALASGGRPSAPVIASWGRQVRLSTSSVRSSVTGVMRSEEHTSELQSLMRISYAGFCLQKKKNTHTGVRNHRHNTTAE